MGKILAKGGFGGRGGLGVIPIPTENIDQSACSLTEIGLLSPNRTQLIAELYLAVQQAGQWFNYNCYNLAARFNHHAAFMHELVCFDHAQGQTQGQFIGIEDDGAVLIQQDDQIMRFYQGRLKRL